MAYAALLQDGGITPEGADSVPKLWAAYGQSDQGFSEQLRLWQRFRGFQNEIRQYHFRRKTFQKYARQVLTTDFCRASNKPRLKRDRRRQTQLEDWLEFHHFCQIKQQAHTQAANNLLRRSISIRREINSLLADLGIAEENTVHSAELDVEHLLQGVEQTRRTRRDTRQSTRRLETAMHIRALQSDLLSTELENERMQWENEKWSARTEWVDQQFANICALTTIGRHCEDAPSAPSRQSKREGARRSERLRRLRVCHGAASYTT